MKKLLTFISTIILGLTLTSCSNGSKQTIVFGTMAQPGEPLIEYIKDDFEAKGYTLKIETFSDLLKFLLCDDNIRAFFFMTEIFSFYITLKNRCF